MTAFIVMGVIVVWAGASWKLVNYLESKERDNGLRHQ